MDKKVLDYIVNLEKLNVKKKHNVIVIDNDNVKEIESDSKISKYMIDGTSAYTKSFSLDCPIAMGTSRMFNNVGIATPITSLLQTESEEAFFSASQDITQVGNDMGMEVSTMSKNRRFGNILIQHMYSFDKKRQKWLSLKDPEIQENLLEIMTPECLDEFNAIALLQELTTYTDGHPGNYLTITNPESNKIEAIVPIDLEFNELLNPTFSQDSYKKTFADFLQTPYFSNTIFNMFDDDKTYVQRLNDIRALIDQGKLTEDQIETIKKALKFDLSGTISRLGSRYDQKKHFKDSAELTSRLWHYNRENLGKDLGM